MACPALNEYQDIFDLLDSLREGPLAWKAIDPEYFRTGAVHSALGLRWVNFHDNKVRLLPRGLGALEGYKRSQQFSKDQQWQWWMK